MIKLTLIEDKPNKSNHPYYYIEFNYMIGDGDGETEYSFACGKEDIEEVAEYVNILNKVKTLKGHWGICFDDYPKEYPGEYIGLSEEEYKKFIRILSLDEYDDLHSMTEKNIHDCIKSSNDYHFLVFKGINIYYYDENGKKFNVMIEEVEEKN